MLQHIKKIPKGILYIGLVSLLINFGSASCYLLNSLYMKKILHFNMAEVGAWSGIVEGFAWILRVFSGILSDLLMRRKLLLVISYSMLLSTRYIATYNFSIISYISSRFIDRTANALQASPRDALISDLSTHDIKGACYGIRHSMAVIGSVIGAIVASYIFTDMLNSKGDFRFAFFLASTPIIVALFVVFFLIKDTKSQAAPNNDVESSSEQKIDAPETDQSQHLTQKRFMISNVLNLSATYWLIVFVAVLYNLSIFGLDMMNMYVGSKGISIGQTMAIQNIVTALVAYPFAMVSDKLGRNIPLIIAFIIAIVSNIILQSSTNCTMYVYIGIALQGMHMGASQSILLAKISETTCKNLRATAFGIYYFCAGLSIMAGNSIIGYIWHHYGIVYSFNYAIIISVMALLFLIPALYLIKLYKDRP